MGRVDEVYNVFGHRLGTAEIESALVSHDSVADAKEEREVKQRNGPAC
jgi:acetyl-CoA synthetase